MWMGLACHGNHGGEIHQGPIQKSLKGGPAMRHSARSRPAWLCHLAPSPKLDSMQTLPARAQAGRRGGMGRRPGSEVGRSSHNPNGTFGLSQLLCLNDCSTCTATSQHSTKVMEPRPKPGPTQIHLTPNIEKPLPPARLEPPTSRVRTLWSRVRGRRTGNGGSADPHQSTCPCHLPQSCHDPSIAHGYAIV